jgi:protein-S-isoprenylcysteine O-methyltransferase Ste14
MPLGMKVALRSGGLALFLLAVIFIPAGTFNYWQAWLLLAVYAISGTFLSIAGYRRDRALFERRLDAGPQSEQSLTQKIIVSLIIAGFFGLFILSSLDHRFGWSTVPAVVVILGNAIVVLAMYVYYLVLRENSFASGTIEVESDQRVIATGPYAIVRHPMYIGLLLMFVGISLAMGSYWGLIIFVAEIPVVVWRLLDEEHFLIQNLPGYAAYREQTRWRLVPGLF